MHRLTACTRDVLCRDRLGSAAEARAGRPRAGLAKALAEARDAAAARGAEVDALRKQLLAARPAGAPAPPPPGHPAARAPARSAGAPRLRAWPPPRVAVRLSWRRRLERPRRRR